LICDNATEESRERMKIMSKEHDGFKIAEYDLKQRGPGDFFGNRQHGLPSLKVADIASDMELLSITQGVVNKILEEDPELSEEKHHALKMETMRMFSMLA
jgi:ATP-dependent DNA helicase RecG